MSEFTFVQPQKINKPSADVNESLSLAAGGTNNYDFSHVASFTVMKQQNRPSLHTSQIIQRFSKNVNTGSAPCPNCPVADSTKRTEPAGGPEVEPTSLVDPPEPAGQMPEPGPETIPNSPGTSAVPAAETESDAPAAAPAPVFIVEDNAEEIGPGQMKKSDFLAQLRREVCRVVDETLAGTDQTTQGCPYISYWFNFYSQKNSTHIERTIHRYAPGTRRVTSAAEYITIFTQRARQSAETWARTGEITGIPEGLPVNLPGMGFLGDIGKAFSGIGGLFLKGRGKICPIWASENPRAIQQKLGDGVPLEAGVRSRMESAFGTDFSHVRTHTDTGAAKLANDLDSHAFTVGQHVAFGGGEYQPGTPMGDALIAHELAHVVQQQGGNGGSAAYNSLEQDADHSAAGVLTSLWGKTGATFTRVAQNTMPSLKSGLSLQRCKKKAATTTPAKVTAPTPQPAETPAPEKTTPAAPTVSVGNFRNSGAFSPDNKCPSCKSTITLGIHPKFFLNFMELRGDITGHVDNAEYDFKRTREGGAWQMVNGTWKQVRHDDPGTDDDSTNDDEDLTPENNHIYSMDGVGVFNQNNPDDPFQPFPADMTEFVLKGSFVEWVNVKVGDGSWTKSSNEFEWHSIMWAEKVGGVWQRKTGKNEIEPGSTTVGTGNP
jgi:hypothetical protein